MNRHQLAAQLYTLRDHCQTPAAIAATLPKVRALGYEAVQVSGIGPIPEADLARLLRDNGLTCCATHEAGDRLLGEPQRVVDRLRALGCTITAYPYPGGVKLETLADVRDLARRLNAAGQVFHAAGMQLCYHNHHIEFRRFEGRTMLEILYAETDPRYLLGEPDTYWIQYGGGNPVAWCERLRDRLPIIHLKDLVVTHDNQVTIAEIGNGNLDWPSILRAAAAAGCQWYCVEQDTCAGDPFDSLRQSFEYLAGLAK
jgi:sugar phosphate isomerase/epimerase